MQKIKFFLKFLGVHLIATPQTKTKEHGLYFKFDRRTISQCFYLYIQESPRHFPKITFISKFIHVAVAGLKKKMCQTYIIIWFSLSADEINPT